MRLGRGSRVVVWILVVFTSLLSAVAATTGAQTRPSGDHPPVDRASHGANPLTRAPLAAVAEIYTVLDRGAWANATRTGWYTGGTEAKNSGGQIHCCNGGQTTYVLETFYLNATNVSVAIIDPRLIHPPAKVVWVPSTVPGMAAFPHVEGGPLAVTAVIKTVELWREGGVWTNTTVCKVINCNTV